jgi:hypothetical protein
VRLEFRVRWCREAVDPGLPSTEANLKRGEAVWTVSANESALVMVDCWADYDCLKSVWERCDRVSRERIAPVLVACREAGMTIAHCPSPEWARNYPQWKAYASDAELFGTTWTKPAWPPEDFRARRGVYAAYCGPNLWAEPTYQDWLKRVPPDSRRITKCLEPVPGDLVVATAGQLHRLCHDRKILHLFYVGFATNICIRDRDYGMRDMHYRGYNTILLRDCTSGIEQPETIDRLGLTEASVLDIELKIGVSTTSDEILRACERAAASA